MLSAPERWHIAPTVRRLAGVWGSLSVVTAASMAARRVPSYRHARDHLSGLAAHGMASAPVMLAGIATLGTAGLVNVRRDPSERRLMRLAGAGELLAGALRCSDVSCPGPGDPAATREDLAHVAVTALTFATWTALPLLRARHATTATGRVLGTLTGTALAASGLATAVCAQLETPRRGLVQRVFIGIFLSWYSTTSIQEALTGRRADHRRSVSR